MPKFKKMILPVGPYMVNRADGKRVIKDFPEDYLKQVVDNFGKMKEVGLRVPAPFKHLKEAVPVTEISDESSYDNAGYWESMEMGKDETTGQYGLVGIIDAPGSEDDMNTPAGKLKHRIKEVSACIKDNWIDGLGRNWGPSILHGAPVTNPVVPNQSEFSLMDESYALSMSGMVQEHEQGDMSELANALRESVGVYIPDVIEPKELVKVLLVSLRQLKLANEHDSNNENEVVNAIPVFMSLNEGTPMAVSKSAAEEIIALGGINPKTNKPFVITDFEIQEEDQKSGVDESAFLSLQNFAKATTLELEKERKTNLQTRIARLVASGRVDQEYADAHLSNQLDTFKLSIGEDSQYAKSQLELSLEVLEKMPAKKELKEDEFLLSGILPSGYTEHKQKEQNAETSPEDQKAILEDMLTRV